MRLTECPYCGKRDEKPHTTYKDRCVECGTRYKNYTTYRHRNKEKYYGPRDARLLDIVDEYKVLQRRGYKVPKSLEEYK